MMFRETSRGACPDPVEMSGAVCVERCRFETGQQQQHSARPLIRTKPLDADAAAAATEADDDDDADDSAANAANCSHDNCDCLHARQR